MVLLEVNMAIYYVNKNVQANGDHEVYSGYLPVGHNRIYLGSFTTCQEAVREAKKHNIKSNGCFYCSLRFATHYKKLICLNKVDFSTLF